jgi:hypothetical protein
VGLKFKKYKKLFRGSFGAAKFLTRMLSLNLRSAFPSKHAEHTHQGLMRTLRIRVLTHMLSVRISSLRVCSA